jgi:tRNA A-37 threonylcarbamoyl transferase component Bud32
MSDFRNTLRWVSIMVQSGNFALGACVDSNRRRFLSSLVFQAIRKGVRWHCESSFAPLLEKVLADEGTVIRNNPTKLITRRQVDGTTYYVKHYINESVAGRSLKYFFKASAARREWELAKKIRELEVPIVEHLAYGERWGWNGLRESILITEGFDGPTLVETPVQQTPEMQIALGKFLRMNHDRGVLQRDLQRNILVNTRTLEMRRVDVHHAEIKAEVSERERRANIGLLNATIPLQDIFFSTYGWSARDAKEIRELSDNIRRARIYERTDRCFKRNSDFSFHRANGINWHVRTDAMSEVLRNVMDDPETWLRTRAKLFKGFERSSTVGAADGVVVKRQNVRSLWVVVKELLRPSRGLRAFRKAHHLDALDIASPRPIAAAEKRRFRILSTSYLVTQEIPNAQELGDYLTKVSSPDIKVAKQLGELIGKLHKEGFTHRDMKETNLLLDGELHPFIIDLDGLKFVDRIPEDRAATDLQRLLRASTKYPSVTKRHRMVFLKHYCRARGLMRVPGKQNSK